MSTAGRAGCSAAEVHVRGHTECAGDDRRLRWSPALLPETRRLPFTGPVLFPHTAAQTGLQLPSPVREEEGER